MKEFNINDYPDVSATTPDDMPCVVIPINDLGGDLGSTAALNRIRDGVILLETCGVESADEVFCTEDAEARVRVYSPIVPTMDGDHMTIRLATFNEVVSGATEMIAVGIAQSEVDWACGTGTIDLMSVPVGSALGLAAAAAAIRISLHFDQATH